MEHNIKSILGKQFGVDPASISNHQCIINDLGADSIDVVEIIMAVERQFKIAIETDEFVESTVQFLLDITAKKLADLQG
jgi:acyl carrier protein